MHIPKFNTILQTKRPIIEGFVYCVNLMPQTAVHLRHVAEKHDVDIALSPKAVSIWGYYEPRLVGIYFRDNEKFGAMTRQLVSEYAVGRFLKHFTAHA